MVSAMPGDIGALKAALERLEGERRWSEIRDRVADLDHGELTADPKIAFLAGEALVHLGHMERALSLVLAAESEFRVRYDYVNLLAALNLAGAVLFELGDLTGAGERFSELLELAREGGDDEMSGRATNNLGAIASLRGDHERALSLFRLSLPAYQKVGFLAGLAQTAHNLGIVHRDMDNWLDAERAFQIAFRRARQLGDERLAAMARVGRAEVSHRRGDDEYGRAEAVHALETFVEIGDQLGRADALRLLGNIAAAQQSWDEASRYFDEALDLARSHSNPLLEAEILEGRGELHAALGRDGLARADLEVAAAIYRRMGASNRQAETEARLSRRF